MGQPAVTVLVLSKLASGRVSGGDTSPIWASDSRESGRDLQDGVGPASAARLEARLPRRSWNFEVTAVPPARPLLVGA
jgi:hypothetical protein